MKNHPQSTKLTPRDAAAFAFVALGACVGAWASTLVLLRDGLALTPVTLAWILAAYRASGIATMYAVGRVVDRHGSWLIVRRGFSTMAAAWGVAGVVVALWPGVPAAAIAAVIAGVGIGVLDVSMNTYASEVDRMWHRPVIGFIHASFSLGALLGSLIVVVCSQLGGLDRLWQRALAMGLVAALAMVARGLFVGTPPLEHHSPAAQPKGAPPTTTVGVLVAMAFLGGITEGTAFDWSSLHIAETGSVPRSFAALGLAIVTLAMVSLRLVNDELVHRFGRRTVVRMSATLAALGFGATMTPYAVTILVGWALVGAGVAGVSLHVFAVAGRVGGGRAMALTVSGAYLGLVVGPLLVSPLVRTVGIQWAMVVPLATATVTVVLARTLPGRG